MKEYFVIGQMSGTSLDGVDLVYINLKFEKSWSFQILAAKTYEYNREWIDLLKKSPLLSSQELVKLDRDYGNYLGILINQFIQDFNIEKVDFIGSHGHTVFHQPENGFTYQIGHGANITAVTNLETICDFRSTDIALGGQGAPLVPIGDEILFSEYDYCLNLGGFANVSFKRNDERIAFDICPANIVLNRLAGDIGLQYDNEGAVASKGNFNHEIFDRLNNIQFYDLDAPKSLGKEWLDKEILPLLNQYKDSVEDKMHTFCNHIAFQVSRVIKKENSTLLITGGGAYNKTLINFIKEKCKAKVVIPSKEIVDFKEALIFALLAVLRKENKINCLKSVTGAKFDSSCGAIYSANYK